MDIVKILKKNISIVIPAAIAVVAVLLFIPTVIIQGKISDKLQQSISLGREVDSTTRTAVPVKQSEIVKTYEDNHQQDACDIQKLAAETSQRELLSYKIFPEPNETSVQIFNEFKRAYNAAFDQLIKDMNALDAPTDIEIRQETGSIRGETPADGSDKQISGTSNEKLVDLICDKRAKQIPCYAKPAVFSGYAFWNKWEYRGTESAVTDCWYCQLAYWIHKDIADTIKKINTGSNAVANSSVKRLLGIRFASTDATAGAGDDELPIYITNKTGGLCQPWTGRTSNNQIDVTHFSLAVIIRADDILKFMDELCSEKTHYFSGYKNDQPQQQLKHNQITILQSSIEPVDRNNQNHKRYRYGQKAIVQLNLICEYVFNKEGYDAIEPNSIKQVGGITATSP